MLLMDIKENLLCTDADGMPIAACSAQANEDERKYVGKLIEMVAVKTGKAGRPCKNVRNLATAKGYDADAMRNFLKKECKKKTGATNA